MSGSGKAIAWDHAYEAAGFIWFASRGRNLDDLAKILQQRCRPSIRRTKAELVDKIAKVPGDVYNPSMDDGWDPDRANNLIRKILRTEPECRKFLSAVGATDEERLSLLQMNLPVGNTSVPLTLSTTATAGPFGMAAMSTTLSQIGGSMTATSGSNALQRYLPEDEGDGFDRPQFDGMDCDVTKLWKRGEQWEIATMVSYAKSWTYEIDPHFAHKGPQAASRRWISIKDQPEYAWAEETKALILKRSPVRRGKEAQRERSQRKLDRQQAFSLEGRIEDSQPNTFGQAETAIGKRLRESANRPYEPPDAEGAQSKRPRR